MSFSLSFTKIRTKRKGKTIMHNHEKLTKREKIVIIGATVVTTCIAGYFGYKHFGDSKQIRKLTEDTATLMAAASEGVFEEAIGTVNHKITYRVDKEKYLIEYLKTHPTNSETEKALSKVESELINLYSRRDKFEAAQKLYEIANED